MQAIAGRWRNMDNPWAVKLWPFLRCKEWSCCSDPIPFSSPLLVIWSQKETSSSWSLEHIGNITSQQTQNGGLPIISLCGAYWRSDNALDIYSGGNQFNYNQAIGYSNRFLMGFLSLSRQVVGRQLQITISFQTLITSLLIIFPPHSILYKFYSWNRKIN